jgi:hypothetical protein
MAAFMVYCINDDTGRTFVNIYINRYIGCRSVERRLQTDQFTNEGAGCGTYYHPPPRRWPRSKSSFDENRQTFDCEIVVVTAAC